MPWFQCGSPVTSRPGSPRRCGAAGRSGRCGPVWQDCGDGALLALTVRSVSSRDCGGVVPAVPSDEEFLAYNQGVIDEFRAHHGAVSQPPFPVLLLTTTGARTGRRTTVPLGYAVDDGRVFVVASKAGAPQHPAWFHTLRANPSVTVELGDSSYHARAVVAVGEERERLYRTVSDGTSAYEKNTDRVFPVVVLEGVPAPT